MMTSAQPEEQLESESVKEMMHKMKLIEFFGRTTPIILQYDRGPSIGWLLEEIHVTWAHLKKNGQDYDSAPNLLKKFRTVPGDGVAIPSDGVISYKRQRQDFQDSVKISKTAERTRMCLFQFSLRDQASNWLEHLPAGYVSTWEDLTTRFLAQLFPPGRTSKCLNDILMFQQHHGESLYESWIRFKDLLQKVPHHGIDLWLQDLALYDNESWDDPRDFAKLVKAISLPQDVPSTSDRRLIELENQVQCLMETHLDPKQPIQVNKTTSSCEICSGPHDTQYCIENPEQAFVD
ncbi:MAK10-like protein, partial [Tanacetum coccineum]